MKRRYYFFMHFDSRGGTMITTAESEFLAKMKYWAYWLQWDKGLDLTEKHWLWTGAVKYDYEGWCDVQIIDEPDEKHDLLYNEDGQPTLWVYNPIQEDGFPEWETLDELQLVVCRTQPAPGYHQAQTFGEDAYGVVLF